MCTEHVGGKNSRSCSRDLTPGRVGKSEEASITPLWIFNVQELTKKKGGGGMGDGTNV